MLLIASRYITSTRHTLTTTSMGSFVVAAVLNSCTELHSVGHNLGDGNPGGERTHCMPVGQDPTYESTYRETHKGEFERVRSLVQRPGAGTFMHQGLTWARQIGLKGKGTNSTTHAPVLVAYIPWERAQDFVKGKEVRTDVHCKFVCKGSPSNKHGKLTFPRWNNYSAIFRCVCNKRSEFHLPVGMLQNSNMWMPGHSIKQTLEINIPTSEHLLCHLQSYL